MFSERMHEHLSYKALNEALGLHTMSIVPLKKGKVHVPVSSVQFFRLGREPGIPAGPQEQCGVIFNNS